MTTLNLENINMDEIVRFVAKAEEENKRKPRVIGSCKACNTEGIMRVESSAIDSDDPGISQELKSRYKGMYSCSCFECKSTRTYSPGEVTFL